MINHEIEAQLKAYMEWIVTPITEDDIGTVNAEKPQGRRYLGTGPMAAVLAGLAVLSLGVVAFLIGNSDDQPPLDTSPRNGGFIVDTVISGTAGDAQYSVGIDDVDNICASTGTPTMLQTTCGGSGLAASAFRAGEQIIVAGFTPQELSRLILIFDDGSRVPLVLTPIPGKDMNAFGAIEVNETRFVEIEGLGEHGELLIQYFPSIGTTEN